MFVCLYLRVRGLNHACLCTCVWRPWCALPIGPVLPWCWREGEEDEEEEGGDKVDDEVGEKKEDEENEVSEEEKEDKGGDKEEGEEDRL